jgi:hypothetical protein
MADVAQDFACQVSGGSKDATRDEVALDFGESVTLCRIRDSNS